MEVRIIDPLVQIVVRIALAIGVLLLGRYLAGKARAAVRRLMQQPQLDQALSPSIEHILIQLAYYGLLFVALITALAILGVPAAAVISVSSVIIVVLAIALRESLANFAATIIFLVFQPFRKDELIETMGRVGEVQEIQLFNTVLLLGDQRMVSLPNGKIQEGGVVNYTRKAMIRADVSMTVSYHEDLSRVRAVIGDIVANDPRTLSEPLMQVVTQDLSENGVRVEARGMVRPDDYWAVLSDWRERIKARFDAEGITFALPQRDVRLVPAPSEIQSMGEREQARQHKDSDGVLAGAGTTESQPKAK